MITDGSISSVLLHVAVQQNRKIVLFLPLKISPKAPVKSKSLSINWQKHKTDQQTRNLLMMKKTVQNQNIPLCHAMGEIALVKQKIIFQGKIILPVGVRLWKGDLQNP